MRDQEWTLAHVIDALRDGGIPSDRNNQSAALIEYVLSDHCNTSMDLYDCKRQLRAAILLLKKTSLALDRGDSLRAKALLVHVAACTNDSAVRQYLSQYDKENDRADLPSVRRLRAVDDDA